MNSSSSSEGVESQPQPTLCSNGCGFFANACTGGMCSKCYRETEQAQQKVDAVAKTATAAMAQPAPPTSAAPSSSEPKSQAQAQPQSVPDAATAPVAEPSAASPSDTPPPSNGPCRCNVATCRKKLGLTGFKCRCGQSFCGAHRFPEGHACSFDFKSFERTKIADNNPVIQAAKVQKI